MICEVLHARPCSCVQPVSRTKTEAGQFWRFLVMPSFTSQGVGLAVSSLAKPASPDYMGALQSIGNCHSETNQ